MNRSIYLLLLTVGLVNHQAQARSFDDIIESKQLVVSVYRDFAPFSSLQEGKAVGIDVALAREIAQQLGVKLKIRWTTADESVEDDMRNTLWKGDFKRKIKSDLMMRIPYDKAYSQLRDEVGERVHDRVHMFAPYHTETWQIAFNSQKMNEVPTMAVFQYHDIGVEVDTVPAFYLTGAFRGVMTKHTQHFSSITLAVDALYKQQVDAVMGLRSQISYLLHDSPAHFKLAGNAFAMMGRQQWDIGMAIKSDYRQLSYAIGDIVSEMVGTGKMAALFKRHHVIYQQPKYYQ